MRESMPSSDKAKIQVSFWGTRGSVSTPGRSTEKYGGNTPCVSMRYENTFIIFDAGTGIRNLGLEWMNSREIQQSRLPLHLFLSHTHWDHIQGLPFFEPAYHEGTEIVIYGSPKKGRFLESILRGQMDVEYFPVGLSELSADVRIREISDEVIKLGKVIVDWQEQIFHPGGSVRYRLTAGGKKVAFATDVELDRIVRPESRVKGSEGYLRDYLDFIKDADLLIADGQFTEEEYPQKAGWGHTSLPVLMELTRRAGVKLLAVFHHDPQHSDKMLDALWRNCRSEGTDSKTAMSVFWAREGMTLAI